MRPLLPLAALLLSACVSPVALKYEPRTVARPLEDKTLPSVFLAGVDDRVGGVRFNGPLQGSTRGSLSDALRDGLTAEFKRLGLPFTSNRAAADALLYATLQEASVHWNAGVGVPVRGMIRFGLAFKAQDRRVLWDGEVSGGAVTTAAGGGAVGQAANLALNGAFADALSKLGPTFESEDLVRLLLAKPAAQAAAVPAAAAPRAPAPDRVGSDLDALPPARPARPGVHAVVIGIERYREQLPRADFASGDARMAAEYFKRTLGVPEENLALLTDERASKGDFEKYFERWLPNRVREGDEVYVYFSGHGAPNPARGDAYLVPYDGDPTYIEQTGYPLQKMYAQLGKLPAKRVLIAMDSCFSGAGGRSVIAQGARPLVTVTQSEVPANLLVLSASAGDQISNSYREKGHGLFTYFFLKGLKEKGPDYKAVFDYLKPEVARVARREYNADQDPQWREGR